MEFALAARFSNAPIGRIGMAFAIAAGLALAGCQQVGPNAIRQGHLRYNEAIADTEKQQVFMNLVRVHDDQPTYFMSIIEVDASVTTTASVTGNATGSTMNAEKSAPLNKNSASASLGGTVGGTLTYSESPIIRYQPLAGSALIDQIVAPIGVDSIAYLFDSEWPLAPILAFTVDRLTPGYELFGSALGAIAELYDYGVLSISAGRSELDAKPADAAPGKGGKGAKPAAPSGSGSGPDDTLFLYLQIAAPSLHGHDTEIAAKKDILRLWARLLEIYQGTQPEGPKSVAPFAKAIDAIHDEQSFAKVYAMLPNNRLELRTSSLSPQFAKSKSGFRNLAPVLRTRSALGALKWSIQQFPPYIDFISEAQFAQIRSHCWNQGIKDFYVLDPSEQNDAATGGVDSSAKQAVAAYLAGMQTYNRIQCRPDYAKSDYNTNTVKYDEDISNRRDVRIEKELNELRRYILVIVAAGEPANAFVSWYDETRGQWLYIARDDVISQRNFNLLQQLLVMQAVPPIAPLTPSLSIGGSNGG